MRIVFTLLFSLLLAACENGSDSRNEINETTIVGTWETTYPATQCRKTTAFNHNYSFVTKSLDEVKTGNYIMDSPASESGRFWLTMTYLSDNGLSACTGDMSISTGHSIVLYAEFETRDRMQLYLEKTGGRLYDEFVRVR